MQNDLISRSALLKEFENRQEQQTNKYCDCFLNDAQELSTEWWCVEDAVIAAPTIDAVEVVRCEHCKEAVECQLYGEHCGLPPEKGIFCEVWQTVVDKNGYCYQGAKMDGGTSDGN